MRTASRAKRRSRRPGELLTLTRCACPPALRTCTLHDGARALLLQVLLAFDAACFVQWLDRLSVLPAKGREKAEHMAAAIRTLPPLEQKWLVRLILGDMKLGVQEESIFPMYHPDAHNCFQASHNLRRVFEDPELHDEGARRVFAIKVCAREMTVCQLCTGAAGVRGAVPK
ncbi:hypothetical protein EON66_09015, partial [archaeon]